MSRQNYSFDLLSNKNSKNRSKYFLSSSDKDLYLLYNVVASNVEAELKELTGT